MARRKNSPYQIGQWVYFKYLAEPSVPTYITNIDSYGCLDVYDPVDDGTTMADKCDITVWKPQIDEYVAISGLINGASVVKYTVELQAHLDRYYPDSIVEPFIGTLPTFLKE